MEVSALIICSCFLRMYLMHEICQSKMTSYSLWVVVRGWSNFCLVFSQEPLQEPAEFNSESGRCTESQKPANVHLLETHFI